MTTTTAAMCGDTIDTAIGPKTCNRPPHTDDLHRDGDGDEQGCAGWRHRPDRDPMDHLPHLLWSNRYEMWWKPNRAGYTTDVWEAGRYTHAEAVAEARCDMHETPPSIVAVPAPEAGYDAMSVEVLATVGDVMRRRVKAATQAVIAAREVSA
jgi:hypothetical protein